MIWARSTCSAPQPRLLKLSRLTWCLVLAAQFESFVDPLVIMLAVPLWLLYELGIVLAAWLIKPRALTLPDAEAENEGSV